jgi:hypothetical protein
VTKSFVNKAVKKNNGKRTNQRILRESSKKQRAKAPLAVENAEQNFSVENEVEVEDNVKLSKHYENEEKLLNDRNLMKDILIKRYYMSFAKSQPVDPRTTELKEAAVRNSKIEDWAFW